MKSEKNIFKSKIFPTISISVGDAMETVVPGSRKLFNKLPEAFRGIVQIGVIGWSSQGPAQAQNLRDSLAGTDIKVVVGLRQNSASISSAEAAGFHRSDGTLGEMYEVIAASDMVLLLISDGAQADNWQRINDAMKPGACLGLSHGFLLGYLKSTDNQLRQDIDIIGVCPKGMGPSVRRLYEQGKETEGAGINCSFAVEQDKSGRAMERALGWAVGIGAPFIFQTTLEKEYRSDIFGERAILLGAVHGIVEVLYRYFLETGMSPDESFRHSVESVTGPLSHRISKQGLAGIYTGFNRAQKKQFDRAYSASYGPMFALMSEIYEEVASCREIESVVAATHRLIEFPMPEIANTPMWQVGKRVRKARSGKEDGKADPVTAGVYIAGMIAQVDLLRSKEHAWSEIVNESIIEAVDSLNPYMAARGVDYMVDNCSTTARLGSRRWAPQFDYRIMQDVLPKLGQPMLAEDLELCEQFQGHTVHDALSIVGTLRPSVDISVGV